MGKRVKAYCFEILLQDPALGKDFFPVYGTGENFDNYWFVDVIPVYKSNNSYGIDVLTTRHHWTSWIIIHICLRTSEHWTISRLGGNDPQWALSPGINLYFNATCRDRGIHNKCTDLTRKCFWNVIQKETVVEITCTLIDFHVVESKYDDIALFYFTVN